VLGLVVLDRAGVIMHGREPIRQKDRLLGWTLSGSFGSTGLPTGLAYVPDMAQQREDAISVVVEIAGGNVAGRLSRLPQG
jgi:hypothetical protein